MWLHILPKYSSGSCRSWGHGFVTWWIPPGNRNRPTPVTRYSQFGFTLIEVLISIAIMSVVMLLIWQITNQSIKAKNMTEKRQRIYHTARVAMQKIQLDLNQAFLLEGQQHLGSKQGTVQLKTVFHGQDQGLNFATLGHQRLFQDAKESESAEIGYRVEPDPENQNFIMLERRESKGLDDRPEDGGVWIPLAERVKKVSWQYYDGKKYDWTSSWNSEGEDAGRLPRAVKVQLVLEDPRDPDKELPFETIVFLEMNKNAIAF